MPTTAAQINAEISPGGEARAPRVIQQLPPYGGVYNYWVAQGGVTYPGRIRKCFTADADTAGQQAAAITSQLQAGGAP